MFQRSAFQGSAYQIAKAAASVVITAAGKLNKRLRRNTRIKARADQLAEQYKKLLQQDINTAPIEKVIKPYSRATTIEDDYQPPKVEEVDFEALARNAQAKKDFLQAVKLIAQQEEEEMALILMLAI